MGWRHYLRFNFYWNTQQTNQTTVWDDTKSKRGWWEYWGGGIIIETEHDRMEQALKTWRLMNSCRDRSDGNSSRSSIPDSFRVLPSLASSSLLLRRIRILIIHTSLPLHFISYCCHCTLTLSLSSPLPSPTATSVHLQHCLLLLSMVLQTPNYAWSATWILRPHNEKVQPFKLPSTRPLQAFSQPPRPSHDGSEKTTNFQAKCLV